VKGAISVHRRLRLLNWGGKEILFESRKKFYRGKKIWGERDLVLKRAIGGDFVHGDADESGRARRVSDEWDVGVPLEEMPVTGKGDSTGNCLGPFFIKKGPSREKKKNGRKR